MKRGEIYWVNFEPARGAEANKTRPAVIVSNDALNRTTETRHRGVITVAPITSNTSRVLSFQVLVPASETSGLKSDSKIQAEQIRSVSYDMIGNRIGHLDPLLQRRLDNALRVHLDL
jgi:mRNA interferase MazF